MSDVQRQSAKTLNMLIAALGGEGGGVLTNWLIEVADRSGWHCQSTSLAGVAQRTGATIYYLEFIQREQGAAYPVMSLFPAQGDIDVAVTSEIAEAGRMLSRGFISPDKTTLISSSHRVFGITEKSATTDGTADSAAIAAMARRYAQRFIHFDINALVKRHGTVISAGLFGAIAGAGVLPFDAAIYLEVIAEGKGASANRAAFLESFERAQRGDDESGEVADSRNLPFQLPVPSSPAGRVLIPVIADFPEALHEVLFHGAQRLVDYQDVAYAQEYLTLVRELLGASFMAQAPGALGEAARWLALWMAFEDIPRVAQLKLRPDRESQIRAEVQSDSDQPLYINEFFHPRLEEIVAILPANLGRWLYRSPIMSKAIAAFLGPRTLRTDTVSVALVLRILAAFRKIRRGSLGYAHERDMIDRWLKALHAADNPELAQALADCGRMVKGYGATRHRTTTRLMAIVDAVLTGEVNAAEAVIGLREAAMQGEEQEPFDVARAKWIATAS